MNLCVTKHDCKLSRISGFRVVGYLVTSRPHKKGVVFNTIQCQAEIKETVLLDVLNIALPSLDIYYPHLLLLAGSHSLARGRYQLMWIVNYSRRSHPYAVHIFSVTRRSRSDESHSLTNTD